MPFTSFLFLCAFSISLSLASPVRDDSSLDQNDATLFEDPVNLEILKESANQPPLTASNSQSTSQLLATKLNFDTNVIEPIEKFGGNPQQPYGDPSANLGTNMAPFASPPNQEPAVSNPPDAVSQPHGLVGEKISFTPACDPDLLDLYCCFGEEYFDKGKRYVGLCIACKNPISFLFFSLPLNSFKWITVRDTLIRGRGRRVVGLRAIRRGRVVLLGLLGRALFFPSLLLCGKIILTPSNCPPSRLISFIFLEGKDWATDAWLLMIAT